MSDSDIGQPEPGGTPPATAQPDTPPRRSRALQRTTAAAQQRYAGSSAEHLWTRLGAMDFINRGMLFAAILLLCFFPFLIVTNALAGRSAVTSLSRHLGLNNEAATDVSHLFSSATSTSNAVAGGSYVIFLLGAVAIAGSIQELYQRAFDLPSRGLFGRDGMTDLLRKLLWVGLLVAGSLLAGWAGPTIHTAGGPVLLGALGLASLTAFWWLTLWLLLSGRVAWRKLLPSAIATALFWIGMEVVFSFIFSSSVISDYNQYGPIGAVFALMSWFIAIGVVIILGAVAGIVWDERKLSLLGPFKALRRRRTGAH